MVKFINIRSEDDRKLGVVAVARQVYRAVQEAKKEEETVSVSTEMATVRVENNKFGGYQIELNFHESMLTSKFEFFSTGSRLQEFTDEIGKLAEILEETLDLTQFEFAELEAASIGGLGELTDFEFKYETGTPNNPPEKRTFDERLSEVTRSMESVNNRAAA